MRRNLIDQRYELRTLIGRGGMADVYLAVDEVLGREVALKLLKDRYAENEEFVERFRREAKSAAALSSPYIVPIFDRGETDDGTYYITMEYLPGGTLKERITATGALRPQAAAQVALQVAQALQTAHVRGVVHRDIKPRNILLADSDHVKVADFGIARAADATTISQTGDILGSAKYMSPEQAEGDKVKPVSDLYSLGVVLYEMLTGRVPFKVETTADVPIRHAVAPPRRPKEGNPEIPEELDAITMKLLATNIEDRCESAEHLIQELQQVRVGIPSAPRSSTNGTTAETVLGAPKASTPSPTSPAKPVVSRRRRVLPALTILAVLLTMLGAVGWSLWNDGGRGSILRALTEHLPTEAFQDAKRPPSGTETVRVPTVKGMTERAARQRLTEAGFEVGMHRGESSEKDTGKVIGQSVPGGKEAKRGSKVLLTVGEGQQVTKVPDVTGLPYSKAENRLEEAGYLLGGVEEATSQTVPAGVIMKQDPPPGTPLAPGSYVYLTDAVGPPAEGTNTTRSASSTASAQSGPSGEVSGEAAAAAGAVRGHYEAIGAGNFEEAYFYFGPTMRSETDEANWVAGEESSQIQSITINSLEVNEVSGSTATATVDFSSVNKAETARFHIVWMLVKEDGEWKLDHQLTGQRMD